MAIDRRRRPLVRDGPAERDASLFVVASEGEKTEPLYFDGFRSRRMQVVTLPSVEGRSSPRDVLDALDRYARRYDIGATDELWLVIDRDRWTVKMLREIRRDCGKKGYRLAVSNPDFEIWLGYHLGDLPAPATKTAIRKHLVDSLGGYQKNRFDVDRLRALVGDACRRARAADTGKNDIWPDPPGSRVYLLMERMAALLGAE